MKRRLLTFLILFALVLGGLELFVRANGASFEALSDRLAFQIRVFERSPDDTAALFLGTSRFADAIDQTVFGDEVAERTGESVWAVNGAMGGINLGEILEFAKVVTESPSLPRVVVEASSPAVTFGPAAVVDPASAPTDSGVPNGDAAAAAQEKPFPDRIENRLQGWFLEHSSLVRYRKALRPRTFVRLAVLYSANLIDPGKWARKGFVRELLTSSDVEIPPDRMDGLQPRRFGPGTPSQDDSAEGNDEILEDPFYVGMVRISEVLKGGRAEVVWVAPPVTDEMRESEGGVKREAVYQRIASDYGVRILDYSGISLDGSYFRDRSHLNEKGRTLFSKLVARDLAESW